MTSVVKRNLRSVNLNLIPVLAELLRCKNVTHAAGKLCLTQSAVSASLKRLREIFDDELLVMHGREMVLTEKAVKIMPAVEQLIEMASALVTEERFDPSTSVHRFRVVTADYVSAIMIGELGKILSEYAPGISLHASQGTGMTAKEIQMGFVDLLIAPQELIDSEFPDLDSADSDFLYEVCLEDSLIAIESTDNPPRTEPITLDEFLKRPHATFNLYHSAPTSVEQKTLDARGLVQNDKFIVPYFTLLPELVISMKEAIAVIPSSLASHYAKNLPIRTFAPPLDFPPHNLVMIWARHRDRSPELSWLRGTIRQAAEKISTRTDNI